jgi:hypothetical protein
MDATRMRLVRVAVLSEATLPALGTALNAFFADGKERQLLQVTYKPTDTAFTALVLFTD